MSEALMHVRAAIAALEAALSHQDIEENADPVVCISQGRLASALETTKEALVGLEDMLDE